VQETRVHSTGHNGEQQRPAVCAIEEAAKKVDEFAFMMNKQEQKNVLCPATL